MTGRDFDTDPSTPGAIQGTTADGDPAVPARPAYSGGAASGAGARNPAAGAAELRSASTDPGLGPAGPPVAPAAVGASQVRVPGVRKHDSVELLLDNMSEPQPERQKTTPQSAGEAAAAYHAEHPLHPARTEPDEQPKVIVERPPLATTLKVQREKLQAMLEQAGAMTPAGADAAAQGPVPITMGPRVLIAAVAGLVVVLVIFIVARGMSGAGTESVTAPAASATATATATSPVADTTEAPVAAPPPTVPVTSLPAAPPMVPVTALPAAPPTAPASKPRPRPTATSGDLGEFKPTFH